MLPKMKSRYALRSRMIVASALGAVLLSAGVQAAELMPAETSNKVDGAPRPLEEMALCCRVFDPPALYKNEENPYIQQFAITHRYQGQYYSTDANTGQDDDWENRRWRLGAELEFLRQFTLKGQFNLKTDSTEEGRFFQDVDTLEVEWAPSDAWSVVFGKHKPGITQEYATSSSKILTFERSLLVNQIAPDKLGGISVDYGAGSIEASLGVFSGSVDDDYELPDLDGSFGVLAKFGYDVTDHVNIGLHYMWQDEDAENDGFADYEHLVSLNSDSEWGNVGLRTDLIYASGYAGVSDVFGLVVLPYYDIGDSLRLVARYQYATADSSDGIRLQRRYERPAVQGDSSTRGDDYHAVYAGLNWYICGENLKLMTGIEWSGLDGDADYDGYTFFTGVRTNF